jgi:hypothetical protein
MIKSAAYYWGATRRNVCISQFSHAHITLIEWTDVWYVSLRGNNVAEWGDISPHPARWCCPCMSVCAGNVLIRFYLSIVNVKGACKLRVISNFYRTSKILQLFLELTSSQTVCCYASTIIIASLFSTDHSYNSDGTSHE